jgi:fimbrial chaperone protein
MIPFARRGALLTIASMLVAGSAAAGSFSLSETRVHLDPQSRTALLRVRNTGESKVVVQISAADWSQRENGADHLEASSALTFFPKIAEIEARGEKTVRVGLPEPMASGRARAMRLFVEELPVSRPGEKDLRFALRLGVPVFVTGSDARPDAAIDGLEIRGDTLLIRVRNAGSAHAFVSRIRFEGTDAAGTSTFSSAVDGWYVLAGATRSFRSSIPPGVFEKTCRVHATVEFGDTRDSRLAYKVDARLDIDGSGCVAALSGTPRAPGH